MGREKAKFYKANLRQQVIAKLTSKLAIGESKHDDKIKGVDKTKKIYSWGSFKTYQKQCLSFVKWLEQSHPEVKSINRAKPYIAEYLNHQLDKGCSAWTINTQAQSINKLYGIKKGDQYFFKCPERRRCDIVRSRYERANDSHYSLKNNSELTEFCRSTGLRRSEVKALQGNEALTRRQLELRSKSENSPKIAKMINDALLLPEKYQYFVYVKSGKGGRTRLAPIIGDKAKEIFAKIKNTPKADKVFPHVHSNADIHSFRSDYATTLYNETARPIESIPYDRINKGTGYSYQSEVYHCRSDQKGIKLDRQAMLYTSKALGHNRIDIVANNYIRT